MKTWEHCEMCGGVHEPGADCDRATREAVTRGANLFRALKIVVMTNEERMRQVLIHDSTHEWMWFLKHIDELAPELHKRGWVEYEEFKHEPGCVCVTTGRGDLRTVVATDAGRKMLNAAVGV